MRRLPCLWAFKAARSRGYQSPSPTQLGGPLLAKGCSVSEVGGVAPRQGYQSPNRVEAMGIPVARDEKVMFLQCLRVGVG
jgi:hypothetical protein